MSHGISSLIRSHNPPPLLSPEPSHDTLCSPFARICPKDGIFWWLMPLSFAVHLNLGRVPVDEVGLTAQCAKSFLWTSSSLDSNALLFLFQTYSGWQIARCFANASWQSIMVVYMSFELLWKATHASLFKMCAIFQCIQRQYF